MKQSATLHLSGAGATDAGRVRGNNEDAYLADPRLGLFIVADGLGGHQAGEVASRLAVTHIRRALAARGTHLPPAQRLSAALQAAGDVIGSAARGETARHGMGSTAVVAWMPPPRGSAWIGHVGDSRAYLWRGGQLSMVTEDHTILNQLRQASQLPADPDDWPARGVLSQALGVSPLIAPSITRLALRAGDVLLLCSDGVTDMLADTQLAALLARDEPPDALCANLIDAANRQTSRDNVTVVIARVAATPQPAAAGGGPQVGQRQET